MRGARLGVVGAALCLSIPACGGTQAPASDTGKPEAAQTTRVSGTAGSAGPARDGALRAAIVAHFGTRADVFELDGDGYRICGHSVSADTVREAAEPLAFVAAEIRGCGCTNGGHTLAIGDARTCDDGCNTCRCAGPDTYTTTLLDCRIVIQDAVFFPAGASQVSAAGREVLDAVAQVTLKHGFTLRVRGHADAAEADPEALSLARAGAVRQALLELGVPEASLLTVSLGAQAPVALDDPARNQRVDFEIVEP